MGKERSMFLLMWTSSFQELENILINCCLGFKLLTSFWQPCTYNLFLLTTCGMLQIVFD